MKTLMIFGHPNFYKSVANACIFHHVTEHTDWNVLDLVGKPTIEYSKKMLMEHDTFVIQFPLYWSTYPAHVKEWIDTVFTEGFAFGRGVHTLKGKKVIFSMTAGATEESYNYGSFNHMPLDNYVKAFAAPFLSAGMHIPSILTTFEVTEESALDHAKQLVTIVNEINNIEG